jgi:hypothetical protein
VQGAVNKRLKKGDIKFHKYDSRSNCLSA